MAKKKKTERANLNDPTDIAYYLHHPHDKYVRAVLQHRVLALELIAFALGADLRRFINLEGLVLTNNTFIDEKLQLNLADICYEGYSKTDQPFRICLLFEHKSESPAHGLYEQLNRYINNVWIEDQKQNRPPTLSIPILIYHGAKPTEKESPARLFPSAPPELLRFVPHFDYVLLDIAAMSEQEIDQLGLSVLRQVLLALKYSRDEKYLRENWKKVVIFAKAFHKDAQIQLIIQFTLLYMVSVSKTVQQAVEQPEVSMSVDEEQLVLPYVFEKYRVKYKQEGLEEGMAKGIAKGMAKGLEEGRIKGLEEGMQVLLQKYIKNNPGLSDEAIAHLFEVEVALVHRARHSV